MFHFSNAFAIDLGTNNTLVYQPKRGIIMDEPTSISFDKRRDFFFGFGTSSHESIGKNPQGIDVMRPLSQGAIANLSAAKAYIKEVIHAITTKQWFKPIIVVSVPSDLNSMERNAVIEAGKEGGAARVFLLKDPFSAALGFSQAIDQPKGVLVLDIGAGVTEISLLSFGGIVMSKSLRIAGNDMDEAIVEYFKNNKRILIAMRDAETLKKELGNLEDDNIKAMRINVKNLVTRLPESFEISSLDVKRAIAPIVDKIVALTHAMISALPPVFAHDIYDQGVMVTGGTSMLRGMDVYLSKCLKIRVTVVKNPLQNIILGAGRTLEERCYSKLLGL